MLSAMVRKERERRSADDPHGVIEEFWVDFETLNDLEHFLAYNRAYIREITFKGTLSTREEEAI
jgi:hypothetical protein